MALAGRVEPRGPLFGVDTMVFVHFLEDKERRELAAGAFFAAAAAGRFRLVASVVALLEVLVLPKRQGRDDLCARYRELFQSFPNLSVIDVGPDLVEIASDLRARYTLRTPDALHVATALGARADGFVTEERRLPRIAEIPILTLDEAVGWSEGEVHAPPVRYGAPPRARRGVSRMPPGRHR